MDDIPDIKFVPITINYDAVFEGSNLPYELLGEDEPTETVMKTVKTFLFNKKKYGKIYIKYCNPISLKEFISQQALTYNKTINDFADFNLDVET
jgi:glycerol-3-phosphate O-acyltransferase